MMKLHMIHETSVDNVCQSAKQYIVLPIFKFIYVNRKIWEKRETEREEIDTHKLLKWIRKLLNNVY